MYELGGTEGTGCDNKLSVIDYDNGRGVSVMRNNDTQIERSRIYLDMKAENHSFRVILHYFTRLSVSDIEKYIVKINFIVRFVQINVTRTL